MTKQDTWFTRDIRYAHRLGYVMLQLPSLQLPAFHYEGIEYEPKGELHCSLLCTQELAISFQDPVLATMQLADFVQDFVTRRSVTFENFTRRVYKCKKDEVQSVVTEVKLRGVDELYAALRTAFPELAVLPDPALHVTLYKYNHPFGIGIQNKQQLRELCSPIPFEQLPTKLQEQL